MNDDIKQGLESLDSKSIEELDALAASCFTQFDATEDVDEKRELLAAARKVTDHKKTVIASSASGGESASTDDASKEEAVTADAGEAAESTEDPSGGEVTEETATTASAEENATATTEEPAAEGEAATASTESAEGTASTEEPAATEEATTASGDAAEGAAEGTTETAPAEGEQAAEPVSDTPPTTTSEETPVTASATVEETNPEVAEDNKPVVASAASASTTTVVAGMDVQGISAGSPFKTLEDVGKAFSHRIRAVGRASGSDGEKHTVATIMASYPESRVLDGNAQGNADKIQAVLADPSQRLHDKQTEAITAALGQQSGMVASGGFCAPLPVRYDIFGLGVTNRPVRDALLMFNANRGGVRFVTPPVLSDLEDAVGLWTSTVDANPGTATKAELKVTCAAEQDAEIDAVTLQLEFGNFMTRAYPELVNRNNELGMIQHARFAEQTLLTKMANESTSVTAASKLGIGIDFLNAIARAGSAYRNRHRMTRTTPLRVIAPDFVLDAMRTDLSQRIAGDNTIALADSMIQQFLAAQNVRVTWHLDGTFGAQADSSPLVEYPSTFQWHLFAEGSFLFLDGGTLDIGVVRDSELVGTNDYKTFFETFEGVAMVGVEALVVTQDLVIEGATVGTIAPSGS